MLLKIRKQIYHTSQITGCNLHCWQGEKITGTGSFVQRSFCQICVSIQQGTCFISPFWHLWHWCEAWICKKYVYQQFKV